MAKQKTKQNSALPSKEELVSFIRERSGKVGTREIARAFGLKNTARAELKRMLRDLADSGAVEQRRKKLHQPGALPPVVLADVTGRDSDGEFIAAPAEWDEQEHGPPPKIRIIIPRRSKPGEAAGVGDRVLLRTEEIGSGENLHHTGRVIKILDRAKHRMIGIFRKLPQGGGRLVPVDKKSIGRGELSIPPHGMGDAEDGELVAAEVSKQGRYGLPVAHVKERLGALKGERAVSLIAIHTHGIPNVFAREAIAQAEAAQPVDLSKREDWRKIPLVTIDPVDARDHDDAVFAEPDTDPTNRGGFIAYVAIADVAHYVTPGSPLDREALERGNSVYFPDRVVPMLPERISNDLCSLKPAVDRAALAVRMVIGLDGRKRSHTFHRVLMKSAAKLNYQQAQDAIDGRPDDATGPLLEPVLKPLYEAYFTIKKARDERGPLDRKSVV